MAIYSDLNQSTPTEKVLKYDLNSIMQSLSNILNTRKTERIFNPEFGASLEDYLFEPMDDLTALSIKSTILVEVGKYEPRVKVLPGKSSVIADYDNNRYDVILAFEIIGLGDQTFEFQGQLFKEVV
jgi:phage baseplate assembly protein W